MADFSFRRKIGRGGFASVYLVAYQDKELYAVKGIRKDLLVQRDLHRNGVLEVLTALRARSAFLARSYAVYQNAERIFLVMKYYRHGSLFAFMDGGLFRSRRRFSEREAAWVLA